MAFGRGAVSDRSLDPLGTVGWKTPGARWRLRGELCQSCQLGHWALWEQLAGKRLVRDDVWAGSSVRTELRAVLENELNE